MANIIWKLLNHERGGSGRHICFTIPVMIYLLLVSSTLLWGDNNGDAPESPDENYKLTRIENWIGVANFWITDLDGDGNDDIFRLYDGYRTYQANRFVRRRVLGPALYQGNSLHYICEAAPMDIDTTPGTEIALVKRDTSGDSLWVEIFKGAEKVLLCKTKAIVGDNLSKMIDHWDGAADECYAEDLDNDGTKEIILPLTVAYDLYPRGVYVYDYPSGELEWWFPLAGNPFPLIFGDANKDGFKEIYVKTFACFNGAVVGDLVDTLSYIHAIDHLGNLLWSQTLGDRFDLHTGEPHLCDCDGDGTLEIYYTIILSGEEFDQRVWTLQKRRARDNFFIDQLQFGVEQAYIRVYSDDLEGDGSRRLLLDKSMCLIDPIELNLIKCGDVKDGIILEIEDFYDEDRRLEILFTLKDSIYIVDADMNIRGLYGRGTDGYFSKLEYVETQFGDHYILAITVIPMEHASSALEVYNVELVPDEPPPPPLKIITALFVGLIMGLILGGVTVYFYMWHRQPTSRLKPARTVQYNNLLTTLTNFDHGRMAGKNLNRLLFLYSNLPESQEKLEEIKPNLMSAIEAYKSFTLSQLNNIIEHTRKLTPIKPAKNRLARETQRLSKALDNFSVADMSVGSAGELKAVVPDAINRIKHSIMEIRGHLKTHFSANLLRVIPDVLSAVAGPLQQQGIGFSEITTRGGVAALVFFDESELASIFEELIGNASDAMAESKVKEMVLDIRFSNGEAVVKLSDTGCGLKTQQEDQVFNRDYSTRGANRGFGLFHAQQQVEQFGGHIKLYNNAIGPGATAELTLKTVKYE